MRPTDPWVCESIAAWPTPPGSIACTPGPDPGRSTADRDRGLHDLSDGLDAWGATHLLPWYHDHVDWDAALLAQWAGSPVDPDGPIGLEVLVSAARERHPEWMATPGSFFTMETMPASLEPLREAVREMIRLGWQPQLADEPDRNQLAAEIQAAHAEQIPA